MKQQQQHQQQKTTVTSSSNNKQIFHPQHNPQRVTEWELNMVTSWLHISWKHFFLKNTRKLLTQCTMKRGDGALKEVLFFKKGWGEGTCFWKIFFKKKDRGEGNHQHNGHWSATRVAVVGTSNNDSEVQQGSRSTRNSIRTTATWSDA